MSSRLINLFESDLLQALPLYVLMGALLNRLTVAPALFRTLLVAAAAPTGTAVVSGLGLGALLAPMSGSVGASVLALARAVEPSLRPAGPADAAPARHHRGCEHLRRGHPAFAGADPARRCHAVGPHHSPSTPRVARDRVINTQDVLRAAIVPAALFLVLSLVAGWYSAPRGTQRLEPASQTLACAQWSDIVLTLATVTFLVLLLGGVAAGYIFAVRRPQRARFAADAGGRTDPPGQSASRLDRC